MGARLDHMLTVVEDQKGVRLQGVCDLANEYPSAVIRNSQGASYSSGNAGSASDFGKLDEPDTAREVGGVAGGQLPRETALANAAGAEERCESRSA
jgi:hypothetical protein